MENLTMDGNVTWMSDINNNTLPSFILPRNITPIIYPTLDPIQLEKYLKTMKWQEHSVKAWIYIIPFICVFGWIGNILTIVVVMTSQMRMTTAGHYMVALAIVDTTELVIELVQVIDNPNLGLYILVLYEATCKMFHYVKYSTKLWSALLVCVITVERFVIVWFPLKVQNILKPKLAIGLIVGTGLFSYLSFIYALFYMGISKLPMGEYLCSTYVKYQKAYNLAILITINGIEEGLTYIILFVFSMLIIIKLVQARRFRDNTANQSQKGGRNTESQVTIMLLAIAIAYLVSKAPYMIFYYLKEDQFKEYAITGTLQDFMKYINFFTVGNYVYTLTTLNFAFNFLIYFIFGSNFRENLKKLCRRKKRTNKGNTVLTNLSTISGNQK